MELDLLPCQPKDKLPFISDDNEGRYDKAIDYFWEYAVSGAGIDQFMFGTMVTIFMITQDEKRLFPELYGFEQAVVWEDEVEGVKMFLLTAEAKCFVCSETISGHGRTKFGDQICPEVILL